MLRHLGAMPGHPMAGAFPASRFTGATDRLRSSILDTEREPGKWRSKGAGQIARRLEAMPPGGLRRGCPGRLQAAEASPFYSPDRAVGVLARGIGRIDGKSFSDVRNALPVDEGRARRMPLRSWAARRDGARHGHEHGGLGVAGRERELDLALQLLDADRDLDEGAPLVRDGARKLTHCRRGADFTREYATSLRAGLQVGSPANTRSA